MQIVVRKWRFVKEKKQDQTRERESCIVCCVRGRMKLLGKR